MKIGYTSELNTLILISLLKSHGIKKIIVSPGTTNVSFVASIQNDDFFELYSAVDERAAAYMACGLSEESGEIVVLSCTGATASRNYIPGLTEAFYKHLPILAVTSTQNTCKVGHYVAQVIDRSEQFEDMIKASFQLPTISNNQQDIDSTVLKVNQAILELTHGINGPVHINLATVYSNDFSIKKLPEYRVIKRIDNLKNMPAIPISPIAIYVGAHQAFDKETEDAIDKFCEVNNAVVLCDHTSNYKGKYRVLVPIILSQNANLSLKVIDLCIYIGYVSGAYVFCGKRVWRVNPDGIIRDAFNKTEYVFEMSEKAFFTHYSNGIPNDDSLIKKCNDDQMMLLSKVPELPFSNPWIASKTASKLPDDSVLHLGILNSLRSWNYFDTKASVLGYSNTGGFGIDGCVSSLLGAAISNPSKEFFGIVGDLAFFYDVNTLFNIIPKNLHLMVINNGIGTEFKNYNHRCAYFGEDANDFMAAKGHNGYKSKTLIKELCINLGIRYFSASSKEEYLLCENVWLQKSDNAVIFEIFTKDDDESKAIELLNSLYMDKRSIFRSKLKKSKFISWFINKTLFGKKVKELFK